MSKGIKIVAEHKREVKEIPPPDRDRISYHKWDSAESTEIYVNTYRSGNLFDVYISKKAEEKMMNHCLSGVPTRTEVMGLLVGDIYRYNNTIYAVIKDVSTTELDANAVHVQINKEDSSYTKLFQRLDEIGANFILVGWYHSHPGHTCFLSETDINTQKKMFPESYHSAIVIDPISQQFEVFTVDNDGGYIRRSHAIFWDDFEKPYVVEEAPPVPSFQGGYAANEGILAERYNDITNREAILKNHEMELTNLRNSLIAKERELIERENMFAKQGQMASATTATYADRMNIERERIESLAKNIAVRDADLRRREEQIKNIEMELRKRESEVVKYTGLTESIKKEWERISTDKNNIEFAQKSISRKEIELKEKESILKAKEEELAALGLIPSVKEELDKSKIELNRLNNEIKQREEALKLKENDYNKRRREIEAMQKEYTSKLHELNELELSLKTKSVTLTTKEAEIEKIKELQSEKEVELKNRETKITEMEEKLQRGLTDLKSRTEIHAAKESTFSLKEMELQKESKELENINIKLKKEEKIIKMLTDTFGKTVISSGAIKQYNSSDEFYKDMIIRAKEQLSTMAEEFVIIQKNTQKMLTLLKTTKKIADKTVSKRKTKKKVRTVWKKAAK
ncbi:MAG: hypothetical protein M1411_00290 [Candidatus Thermoplasmatota archaeon]|nr:hypothetical protein [Candidatus Thermoplasmatota archaeon]